jgi:hypothetical protein
MQLDRRLHAHRDDLAEASLEGRVEARRFTAGSPARISLPRVPMKPRPDVDAGQDTELLHGEAVSVLDRADGWAWVKSGLDG